MKSSTPDRIDKARIAIILDAPFFGMLLMRLPMLRDDSVPTFATDGKRIVYNEKFAQTLSDAELRFVLVHEIAHCAQGHLWRRGSRKHEKWNEACDYQINLMLSDFSKEQAEAHKRTNPSSRCLTLWEMPKCGLLDEQYAGMSSEEIYNRLPDNDGSGGRKASAFGEFTTDVGTPEELEAKATEWQIHVTQAATAARMQGKLPACIERMIGELLKPKVPWREVLKKFIRKQAREDYSFSRPNRRYAASGFILPSLHSERMGRVAIAVDTSGSIGEKELAEFQAEIQCALDECQPEAVDIIYCDAAVNGVDEFQPGDIVRLRPLGGGGTAFEPVFDYIDGAKPPEVAKYRRYEHDAPECLIYLTDGYGSFPVAAPAYPVLWATTAREDFPFGQVVAIK